MHSQISAFQTENYFAIASEEELVRAFRESDQRKLLAPDDLEFPLQVRSYLTWQEPSGVYTYLVFKMPNWDLPRGVVFKRTNAAGEPTGGLCCWCHAYGSSDEIALLSVVESPKTSRSYFLCNDLSCIDKIEDAANLAGKDSSRAIAELYYRMEKLFENLSQFS